MDVDKTLYSRELDLIFDPLCVGCTLNPKACECYHETKAYVDYGMLEGGRVLMPPTLKGESILMLT